MMLNTIKSKYKKYQSKNYLTIDLKDNEFDVFENSVMLDRYYDILSIQHNNQQIQAQTKVCLNLTKLVEHYNECHQQQITEDIFINGGFLLDIYENRDYFVQDDIFQHNNQRYLLIHSKNNFNRINVIAYPNLTDQEECAIAQEEQIKNQTQYMMINMGSVDNIGFFSSANDYSGGYFGYLTCNFYNGENLVKSVLGLSDISILYQGTWYILLENNFVFDKIMAGDPQGQLKEYPYLNLKESKILYYVNETLTENKVKRGCSLKVNNITYNTYAVEELYYGGQTEISKCVLFPYGSNNNIIKTLDLECKYICNTYKIPFNCLNTIIFTNIQDNITIYNNDPIEEYADWAIQNVCVITEELTVNENQSQTIEKILQYKIEQNIVKINSTVKKLNDKIFEKTESKDVSYFVQLTNGYYKISNTINIIKENTVIKYYQKLIENKTAKQAVQLFVKNNNYLIDDFAYNYTQNKWQKEW